MNNHPTSYHVIIAGGGPVGLFLACCLHKAGISCIVLEKRTARITHSRSLGIHPVSLELFQKMGMAKPFVDLGIKIYRGHAFSDNRKLGTVSFENMPLPFNYILAMPQYKTEELLEQHLENQDNTILHRGAEITDFSQNDKSVSVSYKKRGKTHHIQGEFLVGCDGKNSLIRRQSGISFEGSKYPDTYIMGDFTDNTSFNNDAAVFLHSQGMIESFPLTKKLRRWVVKTDQYISEPNRHHIENLVNQRLGHNLLEQENTMISSFGVQRLVANSFAKNRIVLAGDAAHVVSPIGGQGMNLGWINAWQLSHTLQDIIHSKKTSEAALKEYSESTKNIVNKIIKRSEINMFLGRRKQFPLIRNLAIGIMLNTPFSQIMAKLFTMKKLKKWPI